MFLCGVCVWVFCVVYVWVFCVVSFCMCLGVLRVVCFVCVCCMYLGFCRCSPVEDEGPKPIFDGFSTRAVHAGWHPARAWCLCVPCIPCIGLGSRVRPLMFACFAYRHCGVCFFVSQWLTTTYAMPTHYHIRHTHTLPRTPYPHTTTYSRTHKPYEL